MGASGTENVHWIVKGRVQGVGFRFFTQTVARDLGIRGWVRNLNSGEVEVWASGNGSSLKTLRSKLLVGPPHAKVDEIVDAGFTSEQNQVSSEDFYIRKDGGTP